MGNSNKIYIAGKINGDTKFYEKFKQQEYKFKMQNKIVLNPATLPLGMEYEDYMHIGFAMIDVADTIYFLKDYEDSPGALRELEYAKSKGKTIEFE